MRRITLAAVTACSLLALPASASATIRYASPDGPGTGTCLTSAEPCSFAHAHALSGNGDTVRLVGSAFTFTESVTLGPGVSVEGAPGQPRPTLTITDPKMWGILVDGGTLYHVSLVITSGDNEYPTGVRLQPGSTLEDASVLHSNQVMSGVTIQGDGTVLRNVVVRSGEHPGSHTSVFTFSPTTIDQSTLLGDTPLESTADNGSLTLRNTILQSAADFRDLNWIATGSATLNDVNSRIGIVEGSPTGTSTNRVTAAAALDSVGHQTAGSPTIDEGSTVGADPDSADLDGQPRWLGNKPDIGADEFIGKSFVGTPHVTVGSVKATFDVPVHAGDEVDIELRWGIGDPPFAASVTQSDRPAGFDRWVPAEQPTQPATTYKGRFTATDGYGTTETQLFEFTTLPLPDTTLDGPTATKEPRPTFTFSASPAAASFSCAIDGGTPVTCASPWRVPTALAVGEHDITVLATDEWGGVETAAAEHAVTIQAPDVIVPPTPKPGTQTKTEDPVVPVVAPREEPPAGGLPTNPIQPPVQQIRTLAPTAGKPSFRNGRVRIAVTNPNALAAKVAGRLVAKGKTLAKGSKTLAAGASGTLILKLTKAGKKAARKKLRGTVTVSIGALRTTKKLT